MTTPRGRPGAIIFQVGTLLLAMLIMFAPAPSQAQEAVTASPPASTTLIEILKDDAARSALIADLERATQSTASTIEADPERPVSIGRRVAEFTQAVAEQTAARTKDFWAEIVNSRAVFSGLTGAEVKVLGSAFWDLEWMGLNSFGNSAVVLRARIKTSPGKQWGMGRAYNAIVKRIFDERGIEIPFPHQTIMFGQAKGGVAPAAPAPFVAPALEAPKG